LWSIVLYSTLATVTAGPSPQRFLRAETPGTFWFVYVAGSVCVVFGCRANRPNRIGDAIFVSGRTAIHRNGGASSFRPDHVSWRGTLPWQRASPLPDAAEFGSS